MQKQETTRRCSRCHKDVAETNFALHETHCSRFLCVCPDCDEAVPKDQLSQHREEQHTQVRCSKCDQKMERRHLMDHEADECVQRLQSCEFCELQLPWKQLDEHGLACGSRTELCRDCGRYVTLRDQPRHQLTCSAANGDAGHGPSSNMLPPNRVTSNRCLASGPAEDLQDCELKEAELCEEEKEERGDGRGFSSWGATPQLSSSNMANFLLDRQRRSSSGDGGDPNQISTCPHCHLALPLLTLRWHEAKCQIHLLLE